MTPSGSSLIQLPPHLGIVKEIKLAVLDLEDCGITFGSEAFAGGIAAVATESYLPKVILGATRISGARLLKLALFFILAVVSLARGASLGVNIDLPERGGTYVDVVREAYRWSRLRDGKDLERADVDERGWPLVDARFLVDWRPVAEWSNAIDDPEAYRVDRSGTYKCSFKGKALVKSAAEGRVENLKENPGGMATFDFVVPKDIKGFFILEFSNTRDGIKEFKMLRPGLAGAPEAFNPALLSALKGIRFSAIRYMNFTHTNGSDPPYPGQTVWKNRKLPTDASQAPIPALGKAGGASWEQVLALANLSKTDAWINVPISADAGYIKELATLMKQGLDPGLNLYVESSNEVWNTAPGFSQSQYNQAQAKALGLGEHENHARRGVELGLAFEQAFGPGSLNKRVRVVLCSHQPMLEWWVEPMLQYVKKKHGEPSKYFWGLASQTYFSPREDKSGKTAGMLKASRADIMNQLDETAGNKAGRKQWVAKAKAWKLPGGLLSYEGGPDSGGGSTKNVAQRIQAERSVEMGELMRLNLDEGFFRLGGSLAMQFTLSSGYNRYGCWGLTDDIAKPQRNSKYIALRALALTLK